MATNNQNLITCIVTNSQNEITHVGFGIPPFTPVENIIGRMMNTEQFFTFRNNERIEVTFRDGELITTDEQSLDFLPQCSFV